MTRAAAVLAIAATIFAAGCGSLKPGKKGTLSCSCSAAGCSCPHCKGEEVECHCTATDAYPSNRVGDGHD